LMNKNHPIVYHQQAIVDNDQLLTIEAYLDPLNITTMTTDFRHQYLVRTFSFLC
jgi:hypothetical protein